MVYSGAPVSEASQRSTIDKEFWFKPSRRENLVMTSKYERTSVRTDCLGEGEGRLKVAEECNLFLAGNRAYVASGQPAFFCQEIE